MNKKKATLIIVTVIIGLAIIAGLIYWIEFKEEVKKRTLDGSTSTVSKLCDELMQKQAYSFIAELDDKNKVYYVKKDNKAYIKTTYQGKDTTFIIKEGNTYFLVDDLKEYYTYQNNEIDLEKIVLQLEVAKENQYVEGKEKIEGKEYQYEEYEGVTEFLMKEVTTEEQAPKTRFYFSDNKLAYIKTIIGDYQETLKVKIADNIEEQLFEIPAEYKEM